MRIWGLCFLFSVAGLSVTTASAAGDQDYCEKGWFVESEAAFLAPVNDRASQDFVMQDLNVSATVAPFASTLDADKFRITPRLTLGRKLGNGWGVQGRYWEYLNDDGDGSTGPFLAPTPTPDLNFTGGMDRLQAYIVDLEGTKCGKIGAYSVKGSFGVRHAALESSYSNIAYGQSVANDAYIMSALSQNSFHGTGVTYSLYADRDLSCRNFSVYGKTRLSHIFGNNTARAQTNVQVASPVGAAASTDSATATNTNALFIAELGTGLRFTHCLRGCNAQFFSQAGFEYQYWNANDGLAAASSFGGVGGSSFAQVDALSGDSKTQFVGFALSAGFTF